MYFLILKLWIDPLENRNAYGFKPIGIVLNKHTAVKICRLGGSIKKEKYPWPLEYAFEFSGDCVPNFIYKEIPDFFKSNY